MKYEIFMKPPQDFHPAVEVAGCYCVYQDKVLLLKRHPNRPQGDTWGVPAGKLEKGEEACIAILREVYEEVGLKIGEEDLQEIGKFYVRLPHLDYIFHMFHKEFILYPQLELGLEEHLEAKWVTTTEALQLPLIAGGIEALKYYEKWKNEQRSL